MSTVLLHKAVRPVSAFLLTIAAAVLVVALTYFALKWASEPKTTPFTSVEEEDEKRMTSHFSIVAGVCALVTIVCVVVLMLSPFQSQSPSKTKDTPSLDYVRCKNDFVYFTTHVSACTVAYFEDEVKQPWTEFVQSGVLETHLNEEQPSIPDKTDPWNAPIQPPQHSIAVAGIGIKGTSSDTKIHQHDLTTAPSASGHDIFMFGQDCVGVSTDRNLFIVADGVSNAPLSHITAKMVVKMMLLLYEAAAAAPYRGDHPQPPFDLIGHADEILTILLRLVKVFRLINGACTLVMAQRIPADDRLMVWNYGDGKVMLVSQDSKIKMMSKDRLFQPNWPFQLSSKASFGKDVYLHAGHYEKGDTLMVMSDGVLDNLWPRSLAKMRNAEQIVSLARKNSLDPECDVPFKIAGHKGGKPDDMSLITVTL